MGPARSSGAADGWNQYVGGVVDRWDDFCRSPALQPGDVQQPVARQAVSQKAERYGNKRRNSSVLHGRATEVERAESARADRRDPSDSSREYCIRRRDSSRGIFRGSGGAGGRGFVEFERSFQFRYGGGWRDREIAVRARGKRTIAKSGLELLNGATGSVAAAVRNFFGGQTYVVRVNMLSTVGTELVDRMQRVAGGCNELQGGWQRVGGATSSVPTDGFPRLSIPHKAVELLDGPAGSVAAASVRNFFGGQTARRTVPLVPGVDSVRESVENCDESRPRDSRRGEGFGRPSY